MSRCKDCYWDCKRIEDFEHDCKDFQVKSRYEQFREQTATIDGLTDWCDKNCLCRFCIGYNDDCETNKAFDSCKAGIKAYWEGEAT